MKAEGGEGKMVYEGISEKSSKNARITKSAMEQNVKLLLDIEA